MHLNLAQKDAKYANHIKKVNQYFSESFEKIEKRSENDLLKNHEKYLNIFEETKNELTKSKAISFCLNIITETQLAQSSIYILSKKN